MMIMSTRLTCAYCGKTEELFTADPVPSTELARRRGWVIVPVGFKGGHRDFCSRQCTERAQAGLLPQNLQC